MDFNAVIDPMDGCFDACVEDITLPKMIL